MFEGRHFLASIYVQLGEMVEHSTAHRIEESNREMVDGHFDPANKLAANANEHHNSPELD